VNQQQHDERDGRQDQRERPAVHRRRVLPGGAEHDEAEQRHFDEEPEVHAVAPLD
jgi:hypothetical protein